MGVLGRGEHILGARSVTKAAKYQVQSGVHTQIPLGSLS